MRWRPTSVSSLTLLVLGLGVILRLLWLGSDPRYYWTGYLIDEGRCRWTQGSRVGSLRAGIPIDPDSSDFHARRYVAGAGLSAQMSNVRNHWDPNRVGR